ncbi:MAG: alpha/beta hydrolase [Halofilum sp. (in: g-proteobacteria)]|nr:alpha/beta hydrolase [Halofilum sp. (in: g-proteobacteria)]
MPSDTADHWRRYTADELQAQYSARAAVPQHPEIFARWRAASADYRDAAVAAGRARLGLAYGDDAAERIDLFLPQTPRSTPPPLHVFLHGGYWQAMARADFSFVAAGPNAAGAACAVLGYPLCPAVTLDELVAAVRRGYAWLCARADDHGVDARAPSVSGHSAGGHLAALLVRAYADGGAPVGRVHAVSGLFELEPLVHTALNDALGLDVAAARRLSPLLAPPVADVPLTAWVGGDESAEFHRQATAMADHWRRGGATAEVHTVPGRNHFTVLDALYAPGGALMRA